MSEKNIEVFITTFSKDEQRELFTVNDNDHMNIDAKSSVGSDDASIANDEIDQILNKKETKEISSLSIQQVESVDSTENKITLNETSSFLNDPTQIIIPKAVYNYASVVQQTLESPRQNKLDHDIATVLGSSDPPPGFGFLHPQFYFLEQTRPVPLEPLPVWRGYNGHVYFSPIHVRQFESGRLISPTKSLKSCDSQSVPLLGRTTTGRASTVLSEYKNKKPGTHKQNSNDNLDNNNNQRVLTKRKSQVATNRNVDSVTSNSDLKYLNSVAFSEQEDIKQASSEMWQSVVTCAHIQTKPISKRSRHTIDDLQALQQEQSVQDPTGYNRQVLPNIRPVPKSKFVYKGLAYKESQKLPGITQNNSSDTDGNTLQKPLVAYNLAQAYARYEINAARAKQGLRQPPPTAATGAVLKDQQSPLPTSTDLREMRKRIVRGTTLAYRPPPQSVAWTPGRGDHRSTLGSETAYRRPSTSKSSIPQKQTTVVEMPILTKNMNQPRGSSHLTDTPELIAAAS